MNKNEYLEEIARLEEINLKLNKAYAILNEKYKDLESMGEWEDPIHQGQAVELAREKEAYEKLSREYAAEVADRRKLTEVVYSLIKELSFKSDFN
jgi:hypothetical protein